jgi:hypothetical protein
VREHYRWAAIEGVPDLAAILSLAYTGRGSTMSGQMTDSAADVPGHAFL